MHIAMFSDSFYPELSGIADSILTSGEELARRGHFISYYVPRYLENHYRVVTRQKELGLHPNITVHRLPSVTCPEGTGQGRLVLPSGASFFSLRKGRPDVIHFHRFGGSALEAIWAARVFRKPLIGTNHSPILEFFHYSPLRAKWVGRLMYHGDSWLHNRCDFVSSPSQTIFESMKNFHPQIPRRVVSNPIDTSRFDDRFSKKEMKKQFSFGNFTILYVGRLAVEKNIEMVMRAVSLLKNQIQSLEFVIVGRGIYEKELRECAKSLGIAHLVRFFGFVSSLEDLAKIYNASDVFAMMSRAETQSISAMQALACKVPVLAANAWGLKEYIRPETGFLIDANDDQTLVKNILYLYHHPDIRQKMGEAGREHVEQFSIANVANQWEEIYENVLRS